MNAPMPKPKTGTSLRARSLTNFLWLFSGGAVQAVLKILVLAVLARLLTPGEFGVVSAALTIVALADVFGRIGVAPAIVQMPDLRDADIRTGFTITMFSGLVVSGAVYLLADPIASLYAMPTLGDFVRVFSFLFIIRSLGVVSEALLQRRMQFRLLAATSVGSYLFGYAFVAVWLSSQGYGAWALVYGQLAQTALQTIAFNTFAFHSLWPSIDTKSARHLIRFGGGVTLSQIGNYVAMNADYFFVGRFLGADALGFYSRAYLLLFQPAQLIGQMGDKVLLPAMAGIQDKRERLATAFNSAIGLSSLTQLPATVVIVVLAPEIIHIVLGHNWDQAILPFQILVSALFFRTAYKFVGTTLRAVGAVYYAAAWQWLYAVMVIDGALIGVQFGLSGVATGVSLAIAGCFAMGLYLVRKVVRISPRVGLVSLFRFTLISLVLAALLYGVRIFLVDLNQSDIVVFVAVSLVATIFMGLLWLILPKTFGPEGALLVDYLKKLLGRSKGKKAAPDAGAV